MVTKKNIIFFGSEKQPKNFLFNSVCSLMKKDKKNNSGKNPQVNFVEENLVFLEREYNLINTPNFFNYFSFFPHKDRSALQTEIKLSLEKIAKKENSFICLILKEVKEREISFIRWIEKEKLNKNFLIVSTEPSLKENKFLQTQKTFFVLGHSKKKTWKEFLLWVNSFDKDFMIEESLLDSGYSRLCPFSKKKKDESLTTSEQVDLRVIILGIPNSGKSTLMNALLKENRSLVFREKGTTKNPVFASLKRKEIKFDLIDTEGVLLKRNVDGFLLKKTDIVLLMIDVSILLSKQILKLISIGIKNNKPTLIILNKTDLLKKEKVKLLVDEIKESLFDYSFYIIITTCLLKDKEEEKVLKNILVIWEQLKIKINKKQLEELIKTIILPNKKIKLLKAVQKNTQLLQKNFIFYVNRKELITSAYKKHILKKTKNFLKIPNIPIKISFV